MFVSVIVPVYNTEKYLESCIKSVITQSYKNWELILIDDGSIDNSGNICDVYAKKDNRIRVFHITNSGVSAARNYGAKVSKGTFITFLDSDDDIECNFLENAVTFIKKYDLDVVYGFDRHIEVEEDKNSNLKQYSEKIEIFDSSDNVIKEYIYGLDIARFRYKNFYFSRATHARLVKRAFVIENPFNEQVQMSEDLLWNIGICRRSKKCGIVYEAWYNYYFRSDSATNKLRENIKQQFTNTLEVYIDSIEDEKRHYLFWYAWRIILGQICKCYYWHNEYKNTFWYSYKDLLSYVNNEPWSIAVKYKYSKFFGFKGIVQYFFLKYGIVLFLKHLKK